jgi:hypothetical protein
MDALFGYPAVFFFLLNSYVFTVFFNAGKSYSTRTHVWVKDNLSGRKTFKKITNNNDGKSFFDATESETYSYKVRTEYTG